MPADLEHQLSVIAGALDRQVAAVTLDDVLDSRGAQDEVIDLTAGTAHRRHPIRWACAVAASAALIGVVVAIRHDSSSSVAPGGTSIDLASLDPADEVAITSTPIDLAPNHYAWTAQIDIPGARPFVVGTPTDAMIENFVRNGVMTSEQAHAMFDDAICVGRVTTTGTTSAGCGKPLDVTLLVVERTGTIDTIVWLGLPNDTAVVVLDANGSTYWEHPVADTAAFDTPWCEADSCGPFTLTAYDAIGHQIATTSEH